MSPIYTPIHSESLRSGPYDCEELRDDRSQLKIFLADESGERVDVIFDGPIAYRLLDEGDALKTVEAVHAAAERVPLYEARDSEFLLCFFEQNYQVRQGQGIRHFIVMTVNDVIDVLAFDPPLVAKSSAR